MKRLIQIILLLCSASAFAQSTDSELTTQANVIRNETIPGANTPLRIGNMFRALIDSKKNIDEAYTSTTLTTNNYAVTINPGVTGFSKDFGFYWKVNATNTGVVTLAPNGLVAKSVRKNGSTVLASGDIVAGRMYPVIYDVAQGWFQILLPGSGGGGGAVAFTDLSDVPGDYTGQAGKTVVVKGDETGLEFTTSATTPTLQQVLTAGSVLTGNNAITGPRGLSIETGVSAGGINGLDVSADQMVLRSDTFYIQDIAGGNTIYSDNGTDETGIARGGDQIIVNGTTGITLSTNKTDGIKLSGGGTLAQASGIISKTQVGEYIASRQYKSSVKTSSTANIADLNNAGATIDGISLGISDRVLLKDQSTGSQNGIYSVSGVTPTTLNRASDFSSTTFGGVLTNSLVLVDQGTANGGKAYRLSTTGTITIGTTALTFTEFGGVVDAINDGVTASAPSQNAVFDALALKENLSNKATDFTTLNNTLYPTTQAVENRVVSVTSFPGVNFAPAQSFDPSFVVFAAGIPRPSNSYSNGAAVTWEILDQATNHNSSFFTSATVTGGSNNLTINYPTVKNVIHATTKTDETFGLNGVTALGPSVGLSSMNISAYRTVPLSMRLRGQATTTWLKNGAFNGSYTIGTISGAGITGFNVDGANVQNVDYLGMAISYIGTNNYTIRRIYSGLGANNIGFALVNSITGQDVTTSPTSTDEVLITGSATLSHPLPLQVYSTANQFMAGPSSAANFWVYGVFECWLVTVPVSTSTVQVRWQPTYPSATNYKIYRDTQSSFATQVLIHTGTSGSYLDTGLSTNTLYYYKLVGVISGVDTDITTFKTNTKAF